MTRRDYFKMLGAGAAIAQAGSSARADENIDTDRERRMKWWHEARFGMFIHFGVYSTIGRHEWVMEKEGMPVAEYERSSPSSSSRNRMPRATWAKLAKAAGQKYMVMTTKHHEGFCNFRFAS